MSDSITFEKKQEIIHEKVPTLALTIKSIRKTFGDESIIWFGEKRVSFTEYDVVETGLLGLDYVLGNHGLVKGRIVEIYGQESSGKTTLALHIIAQMQLLGGMCGFIDAEHQLDPKYAANIGVDLESLLINQPDNGEQGLDITEALIRSGGIDLVVIDSVPALVPKEVKEKGADKASVAALARIITPAMHRINELAASTGCIVIFLNQIRDKISIGFGGGGETTPGGHALKHYATYRIPVTRTGQIKKDGEVIGQSIKVRALKNKAAPPYREAEFDIMFYEDKDLWGITSGSDLYNVAETLGFLSGKTVKNFMDDIRLGNGQFECKLTLDKDERIREKVLDKLRKCFGYSSQIPLRKDLVGVMKPVIGNLMARDVQAILEDDSDGEDKSNEDLIRQIMALQGAVLQKSDTAEDVPKSLVDGTTPKILEDIELPDFESLMPKDEDFVVELPTDLIPTPATAGEPPIEDSNDLGDGDSVEE